MQELEKDVQSVEEVKPAEVKKKPRTGLIVGAVIGLAVLLAGAAFVGGRLLNSQPQTTGPGGPGGLAIGGPGGAVSVEVENAKELPQSPPDVTGIFSRREDNSIFVTSGDGTFTVTVDESGHVNTDTGGSTQEVEVVVTGDTVVYKDVTQSQFGGGPPSSGKVQQKVEPGSADEIGENSFVTAWGERRGDRLIASVVLYSQPMIFGAPGAP
jgi:hypothetical protein